MQYFKICELKQQVQQNECDQSTSNFSFHHKHTFRLIKSHLIFEGRAIFGFFQFVEKKYTALVLALYLG